MDFHGVTLILNWYVGGESNPLSQLQENICFADHKYIGDFDIVWNLIFLNSFFTIDI